MDSWWSLTTSSRYQSMFRSTIAVLIASAGLMRGDSGITDARTPAEIGAGVPSSSYALSQIESIDPYSGSVHVHIPLLTFGGRGNAKFTINLVIQHLWLARGSQDANGNPHLAAYPSSGAELKTPNNPGGYPFGNATHASAGQVIGRTTLDATRGSLTCTGATQKANGFQFYYGKILTRLTYIDSIGNEHELVDTLTNGQPTTPFGAQLPNCGMDPLSTGNNRGQIFQANDGSGIRFVSDQSIFERAAYVINQTPANNLLASGWLMLPDGTRDRVDNGTISKLEDRNGNLISFAANSVIDSLGRTATMTYADFRNTFNDTIAYQGSAGTARQITVSYVLLQNALAPGQVLLG